MWSTVWEGCVIKPPEQSSGIYRNPIVGTDVLTYLYIKLFSIKAFNNYVILENWTIEIYL